jgi:TolA-binding protein
MNLPKPPSTEKTPAQESGLVEWFLDEFVPRYGKQSLYVLVALALVIGGAFYLNNSRENQSTRENKELGQAFVYLSQDKADSAEAFLSGFLKASHSRPVQDKANLMLGSVFYGKGKYDDAIKAYEAVDLTSTKRALISSGALHGLAASYIQKKDYTKASELLETFVSRFMKKTGNPSEKVEGKEVADLSPVVPNALWKLALSYNELKNTEKAKATAQKLIKVYPESKEAFDATRFLAGLP